MKIIPYGAAGGEVTGSSYLVETDRARVLIDCGLFQGTRHADAMNRAPHPPDAARLDATLLTHGHLDHTGRLPLLRQAGFNGPIHATPATIEMTGLILRDAAKIQVQDNERMNRKRALTGQTPLEPLYTPAQVEEVLQQLQPVDYRRPLAIAPGVEAEYVEAGHMLGSASIQLTVTEEAGHPRRIVFSGDIGQRAAPILRDAETFKRADMVFLESTYGDRDHRPFAETVREFVEILKTATASGGKILVPTFAVGRAQLLSVLLAQVFRQRTVNPFPVFLDSPMAIEAWKIYERHAELFDEEMTLFLREGSLREDLATLKPSVTAEDSKKLNDVPGPCLIMAGAGMCNAGRILHHLRNNLSKPETHVVIVGYQGDGSLGRRLVEGDKLVRIFGEEITVKATVHTLNGFSAHAGQTDLLKWFGSVAPSKPRVVLTHGEDGPRTALAEQIKKRNGISAELPQLQQVLRL